MGGRHHGTWALQTTAHPVTGTLTYCAEPLIASAKPLSVNDLKRLMSRIYGPSREGLTRERVEGSANLKSA
jgi:hypothetical protein